MRLAILGARGIPARYGGFETFAEKLATGLVQRGHDVTVYAQVDAAAPARESADTWYHGVRVRHIPVRAKGPLGALLYDIRSLWDARRGHDVVYLLGYGAVWAGAIPRLWGRPLWVNIDGLEWRRSKWSAPVRLYLRAMEAWSARIASLVVADAQAIAEHHRAAHPRGAPCTFIPYGAEPPAPPDDAWLAEHGLEPGGFDLLIARLEPENHVHLCIQAHAAAGLDRPLVVVGDHTTGTAYVGRLQRLAHPRIRWLGAIYDARVLDTLRQRCHVYLHGHSVGGTNPSLLEAMAAGCAVLAHDNPFNREVLGPSGRFFRDAASLVQALGRLSEAERADMQRQARQRIAAHYTWPQVLGRYEELLAAACARSRPPAS